PGAVLSSPSSPPAPMKLIDISVPLDGKLPTYPNNTPFQIEPTTRIAEGGSSNVSPLRLSAHTGTHVDAPRHFFDSGPATQARPHQVLLGAGTIVIEGLNLLDVEPGVYDMFCLPLPIVGSDGAPARVVLRRS